MVVLPNSENNHASDHAKHIQAGLPKGHDAIVILDSQTAPTDFVANHAARHIYLTFDDARAPATGKQLATLEDIRRALDFASASNDLLVCCRAGQSRSAATAFIISYRYNDPQTAIQLLNPARHIPNSHVVDIGATALEDGGLVDSFQEWQNSNRDVRLSDYYDEIEAEFDALESQGARNQIVTV